MTPEDCSTTERIVTLASGGGDVDAADSVRVGGVGGGRSSCGRRVEVEDEATFDAGDVDMEVVGAGIGQRDSIVAFSLLRSSN